MQIATQVSSAPVVMIVCFHLAEQKHNNDYPFAFLATYAIPHDNSSSLSHIPLGRAVQEGAAGDRRSLLLTLLLPIQRAAEKSKFLSGFIESGEIFQPIALSSSQAHLFLKDIHLFEEAGITVRVPNWWSMKKPPRPTVTVSIDKSSQSLAGLDSLLDFDMYVSLPDGNKLSLQEVEDILEVQDSLVRIRGQWMELDIIKLRQVLDYWKNRSRHGVSLAESLRIIAGVYDTSELNASVEDVVGWSTIIEGNHLREIMAVMRNPELFGEQKIKEVLAERSQAQLRPYQLKGVSWLWMLYGMRLGGCLADDMGLGKTIQILSHLLLIQKEFTDKKHLLVVPASLLGNWSAEINRFAPGLRYFVWHSSEVSLDVTQSIDLSDIDVVITTYGLISKLVFLHNVMWDVIIIDEAQAIKNPHSKQTQAVKRLNGRVKYALTGTPIENSLLDLWSLFDFVAPGLLGSSKKFAKLINNDESDQKKLMYAAIQRLVSPYILRRLKSDKRVIDDLPDKTELAAYCYLTKHQAVLYQKSVDELTSL
jgi:Superfamily II DNA/RNA helicases, SNF2 family